MCVDLRTRLVVLLIILTTPTSLDHMAAGSGGGVDAMDLTGIAIAIGGPSGRKLYMKSSKSIAERIRQVQYCEMPENAMDV